MKTSMENNNPGMLTTALEQAAKHICTARCGRCPHVVEHYPCPGDCTLDTVAWECWMRFFLDRANHSPPRENTD